jgi:hypothetical protein
MLKTIERATHQPIAVEQLPTIADLHARRLELTRAALRESLLEDDLERFRGAVEPLAEEFDVLQVALAAVKLAHEATGAAADADEIPEAGLGPDGEPHGRCGVAGGDRRRGRAPADGSTRLFVGAGRAAGMRPQDLVGAIAGESRLSGRDIGAIEITDRFSLVEVPESAADEVIAALRATTVKGVNRTASLAVIRPRGRLPHVARRSAVAANPRRSSRKRVVVSLGKCGLAYIASPPMRVAEAGGFWPPAQVNQQRTRLAPSFAGDRCARDPDLARPAQDEFSPRGYLLSHHLAGWRLGLSR